MSTDCYKLNPLQRGGTSRNHRALRALLPDYIQMDERRIEDLILFADKYAALLAYYTADNTYDGDWQDFIATDISTILARIVKTDYTLVGETFDKYRETLEKDPSPVNYKTVFAIIFSLFLEIQRMNDPATFNAPIKDDLDNEIKGRLGKDMKNLIAYYKGGISQGLVDDEPAEVSEDDPFLFRDVDAVLGSNFSVAWIVKDNEADDVNDWEYYHKTYIASDTGIFGDAGWSIPSRINYSLSFIKAIFNRAYEAYIRMIKNAATHLLHSLEKHPDHKAHNALLLVFFKIFFYAQEELNRLTERHLRFYFREVLRLEEKPAVPDSAHILVQPAKHKDTHLIEAGTELKGGKDKTGKDLIYMVDEGLVVNKGEVAALKTLFIDRDLDGGGVYDAPTADSLHGLGEEELDPEKPYWRTFGQPQRELEVGKETMQRSDVGLAIASPILRLKEGVREIYFLLFLAGDTTLDTAAPSADLAANLEVTISGEKEWIQCAELSDNISVPNAIHYFVSSSLKVILIKLTLGKEVEPVADFNPENLEGGFGTSWPVVRIRIKKNPQKNVYELLRNIKVNGIEIIAVVSGMQDLVLHNDHGPLDAAKPFLPFGPRPKKGSTFYIGSHEALSKQLYYLSFDIEWMGLPDSSFADHYSYQKDSGSCSYYEDVEANGSFQADISFLKNGEWEALETKSLFSGGTGKVDKSIRLQLVASGTTFSAEPDREVFKNYNLDIKGGFLKLELSNPPHAFGHDLFAAAYSKQAIHMAKSDAADNMELPNEPYTPTIQSITLTYSALTDISFGNDYNPANGQFFHLHPFGHKEVKGTTDPIYLVPQFAHQAETAVEPIQGALYIGIKNIEPRQTASILFQVAEGTEDFSKDPSTVVWSFLANNRWVKLDVDILADSTNNLLGSGIIRFKIPGEANDDNTLLPKDLRWIRASIKEKYDAFPQMTDVKARALKATFQDRENDPNHLASPLKANSISKLLKSDSAIKKIGQPYESFNGRMQEQPAVFYHRVSERLRHKNRAITIWDYERLVLEEFPFIYKVKCLNHTDNSTEMAPGSVRIVVVPDMRNKKAGSKLKPAVSNNTRKKIKEFLEQLNCDFVDLAVENPRYEAVKVNCNVAFYQGFDPNYYKDRLKTDIDKFLAPWAFDYSREIEFGGSLDQSVIIKFVEDLPYVDFVTDFYLDIYSDDSIIKPNVTTVTASTSRSVLTGHSNHNIGFNVCAAP